MKNDNEIKLEKYINRIFINIDNLVYNYEFLRYGDKLPDEIQIINDSFDSIKNYISSNYNSFDTKYTVHLNRILNIRILFEIPIKSFFNYLLDLINLDYKINYNNENGQPYNKYIAFRIEQLKRIFSVTH